MIDRWLNNIDRLNSKNLFWIIIGASILLAAWMQYIQHGWINPDSVLYLEQAKRFSLGEWSAGFNVFRWPLYGICIGLTQKLTTLPIQVSAQLLNMLFFGIATASFLQLIKLAGGSNRTWLMGTLLLFSSQYIVGDVLEMLMRDEGFWAFYLTALVFLVRYIKQHKINDGLIWQLSIIIATLFRIEAILFLLCLPLISLFGQANFSIKHTIQHLLHTYSISLFIGLMLAIAISTQPQISMSSFGRLDEIFTSNLYQLFTQQLFAQADIMSNQVLGKYLDEFAVPGLLLTFIYVIGSKILSSAGLIGTGLAFFSFKKNLQTMPADVKLILLVAGGIALFTAALIIIKMFVLSSRYVIALAWIILIFASFYLTSLSFNTNKKGRVIFLALLLVLTLCFIKNILPKRDGYNYKQDAVAWVKALNKDNKQVFYNETRMAYYANEPFLGTPNSMDIISNAIDDKTINQYSYLLISSSKKEAKQLALITDKIPQFRLIKTFKNYKQKKFVLIFRRD